MAAHPPALATIEIPAYPPYVLQELREYEAHAAPAGPFLGVRYAIRRRLKAGPRSWAARQGRAFAKRAARPRALPDGDGRFDLHVELWGGHGDRQHTTYHRVVGLTLVPCPDFPTLPYGYIVT